MSFETPLPPYNASDPSATFLNSSCLDLLLIELVPLAYRLAHDVDCGKRDGVAGFGEAGEKEKEREGVKGASVTTRRTGTGGGREGAATATVDEDEERDAVFFRLEMLGYRVGQGLVERYGIPIPPFHSFSHLFSSPRGIGQDPVRWEWEPALLRRRSWLMFCSFHLQILPRSSPIHGYPGRDQVPMQGPLAAGLQETDRQPEDESSGSFRPLRPSHPSHHFPSLSCSQQYISQY
jgi:hypothetical protein